MSRLWSGGKQSFYGRDEKGRFTEGNKGFDRLLEVRFGGDRLALKAYLSVIGRRGWESLVSKRFEGETLAAKDYVAQLGRHANMLQTSIRRKEAFAHPGTPEQWLSKWRSRVEFTLADVGELNFTQKSEGL